MTIPLKKWKKFLTVEGLICKRIESSHEIWDKPDDSLPRPIVVDSKHKEVPMLHISTGLRTLGISRKDFLKKIQNL